MSELRGANVLLTGASRGIGTHIARALASRGANLALVARNADELERQAASLAGYGVTAVALPADLTDHAGADGLAARAEAALGPIDILVSNAGAATLSRFWELDEADLRRMVDVNFVAAMLLTRRLLPGMLDRGRGHLVTLASLSGRKGLPYVAVYSGSKAALINWMEALHAELEGTGVKTSIVLPGYVSGAGFFADLDAPPPRVLGASPVADVARAVVRAIESERQEVTVTPMPIRPFLALCALSPALGDRIPKMLGVIEAQRWMADHRQTG